MPEKKPIDGPHALLRDTGRRTWIFKKPIWSITLIDGAMLILDDGSSFEFAGTKNSARVYAADLIERYLVKPKPDPDWEIVRPHGWVPHPPPQVRNAGIGSRS